MGEGEGVRDRKYYPCPNTLDWSVEDRLRKCPMCGVFLLYCCNCNTKYPQRTGSDGIPIPCHHFRVVFTDGACSNNGKLTARAGMGMVCGDDEDSEASIPITDMVDSFPLRSSQRAELCAAQYGIVLLAKSDTTDCGGETREWVVATDSEYVVKGLSEWLPSWKKKGWRTSKGTKPANLDLFLALDKMITAYEAKNTKIGFWHIPREENQHADYLAKAAAMGGDVATILTDGHRHPLEGL